MYNSHLASMININSQPVWESQTPAAVESLMRVSRKSFCTATAGTGSKLRSCGAGIQLPEAELI